MNGPAEIGPAADEPGDLLANALPVRDLRAHDPAGCAPGCLVVRDCPARGRLDAAASAAVRSDRRRDHRSGRDRGLPANRSPAARAPCVAAAEACGAAGDLAPADVGLRMVRPTTVGLKKVGPKRVGRRKKMIRRRGGDRGRGLHDVACAAGDHQMNCSGLAARVRWLSMQIYGERGVRRGGACSEASPTGCGIGLATRQVERKCAQARPAPPNSNLSPRRRPKQQP